MSSAGITIGSKSATSPASPAWTGAAAALADATGATYVEVAHLSGDSATQWALGNAAADVSIVTGISVTGEIAIDNTSGLGDVTASVSVGTAASPQLYGVVTTATLGAGATRGFTAFSLSITGLSQSTATFNAAILALSAAGDGGLETDYFRFTKFVVTITYTPVAGSGPKTARLSIGNGLGL